MGTDNLSWSGILVISFVPRTTAGDTQSTTFGCEEAFKEHDTYTGRTVRQTALKVTKYGVLIRMTAMTRDTVSRARSTYTTHSGASLMSSPGYLVFTNLHFLSIYDSDKQGASQPCAAPNCHGCMNRTSSMQVVS